MRSNRRCIESACECRKSGTVHTRQEALTVLDTVGFPRSFVHRLLWNRREHHLNREVRALDRAGIGDDRLVEADRESVIG